MELASAVIVFIRINGLVSEVKPQWIIGLVIRELGTMRSFTLLSPLVTFELFLMLSPIDSLVESNEVYLFELICMSLGIFGAEPNSGSPIISLPC